MNYSSSIPSEATEVFEREMLDYQVKQRDSRVARNLSTMRSVGASVQTDTVTYFEKSGGASVINAAITAKGDTPPTIGVKGKQVSHAMYQLSVKFSVNERDLNLDPRQMARKVDVATRDIGRLEDNIWINGDTATGLTGLDYAAGVNPNGSVTAAASSGVNTGNVGAWDGSDTNIDIYEDIRAAVFKLGDDFEPAFLLGRKVDLAPIAKLDDMRKSYADEIPMLFGKKPGDLSFMKYSLYCPSGYVYVVAKDMEFTEFVISEDLRVDTSVGKDEGGNFPVVLREWCNPVEFHANDGVVEIQTT